MALAARLAEAIAEQLTARQSRHERGDLKIRQLARLENTP